MLARIGLLLVRGTLSEKSNIDKSRLSVSPYQFNDNRPLLLPATSPRASRRIPDIPQFGISTDRGHTQTQIRASASPSLE